MCLNENLDSASEVADYIKLLMKGECIKVFPYRKSPEKFYQDLQASDVNKIVCLANSPLDAC